MQEEENDNKKVLYCGKDTQEDTEDIQEDEDQSKVGTTSYTKGGKNKVEAILYTTGKFMTLQEIAGLCGFDSLEQVKAAIEGLKKEYAHGLGSLMLFEENGKYKLSIKKEYNYLTTKLVDLTSEMDRPTQETLAIIAYKQPCVQAEVIKIRGNKAYDHVSNLRELGFITSEKHGRTRLLKLTQKFFDYFDLVEHQLKSKFEHAQKIEQKTKEAEQQLEEKEVKPEVSETGIIEEVKEPEVKVLEGVRESEEIKEKIKGIEEKKSESETTGTNPT